MEIILIFTIGFWAFCSSEMEAHFNYAHQVSDLALLQRSIGIVERAALREKADDMMSRLINERTRVEENLRVFTDAEGAVAAVSNEQVVIDGSREELDNSLINQMNDADPALVPRDKTVEVMEKMDEEVVNHIPAVSMAEISPEEAMRDNCVPSNAVAAVMAAAEFEVEEMPSAKELSDAETSLLGTDHNVGILNQSHSRRSQANSSIRWEDDGVGGKSLRRKNRGRGKLMGFSPVNDYETMNFDFSDAQNNKVQQMIFIFIKP